MTADVITDKKKRKKTPVCLPVCVCGGGCGREVAVTGGWEGIEQFFLFGQKKENKAEIDSQKNPGRRGGKKFDYNYHNYNGNKKKRISPKSCGTFFFQGSDSDV